MLWNDAVSAGVLKLGDEFELDLGACELRKNGEAQRLGRIPMELLLLLVQQRGQLVTREKIIERVWGKDVFLDTDNSINAAIRKIRQVLEDDAEQPRYVQTLIGRGYSFVAEIKQVATRSTQGYGSSASLEVPNSVPAVHGQPAHGSSGENSNPSDSSADIAEITAVPEPHLETIRTTATRQSFLWRKQGLVAAACVVLTLGLASTVGGVRERLFSRNATVEPLKPLTVRPSIAVLGFKNLSGRDEEAWLSTALSEMLDAELASGQKLRMIAGENVARMKMDLALP